MIKDKNAESLIGIVIGVFILSIVLIGIINMLNFNKTNLENYNYDITKYILDSNARFILKKIDVSNLLYDEEFYIYKDTDNKELKIFTGAINEEYAYINAFGEKVDPSKEENIGKTYKRVFFKQNDVLRDTITPNEISNLIIHFDANNIDGTNNSSLNDGDQVGSWKNLANNFDAYQDTSYLKPIYKDTGISGIGGVLFDGINDLIILDNNTLFNNDCECGVDSNCYSDKVYTEKSFALTFKTGFDVSTKQVIYEQGGAATGYNFMINDGNLYAGIHNKADDSYNCSEFSSSDSSFHFEWDSGYQFKSVNLGEILPDTVFFVMIVQDSTHIGETGDENINDTMNRLQIYLNGILVDETDHVDPQPEHWKIGIGNINERNVEPWSPYNTISQYENLPFSGYLGEFISWNHALSITEIHGIQNYFLEKWLGKYQNIIYDNIKTTITKYNNY